MLNVPYETDSYTLRSAGPIPVSTGNFIVQTFGVNKSVIKTYEATTSLLRSDDMAGQGGDYISASYSRLPYLTEGGQEVFSGSEVVKPVFINNHELEI